MNTQKHTPWIARPYGDDDGLWAVTNTTGRLVFLGRYEAEARLIAAAADLLPVVKALPVEWLREGILTDPKSDGLRIQMRIIGTTYEAEILVSDLRAADAAIRKAEGGAS